MNEENEKTYQRIMAIIESNAKEHEKLKQEQAERDKRLDKQMEETAKRMEETAKQMEETDRKLKELNIIINGVSNNLGHHAETYFQDALAKTKKFGGKNFDTLSRNLKAESKESCEFDVVMFNGDSVAIIEAKNRIHPNFVEELVTKKVAQFRKHFPKYADCALFLGVAGFSFDDSVIEEAKKYGVGIIKQVGDTIELDDSHVKPYN